MVSVMSEDDDGFVLSFLKSLFKNKLLQDARDPIFEFSLPSSSTSRYALYAPGFELWKQLGMVRFFRFAQVTLCKSRSNKRVAGDLKKMFLHRTTSWRLADEQKNKTRMLEVNYI